MTDKTKRDSPLVQSVLALDHYLSELERIGAKINSADLAADPDFEHIQKLMNRFAECGQGVSEEVTTLSSRLLEARARAEAVAAEVSKQAERLREQREERNEKLLKFRVLGEKVRQLNAALNDLRSRAGAEDREALTSAMTGICTQLAALVDELKELGRSARESGMKTLEKNAESLAQTLQALHQKLQGERY
jgi:uncharacterized coiled-coil DUF342 family protein